MKKRISYFLFWISIFTLLISNTSKGQINYRHFIFAGQIALSEKNYTEAIRDLNTAIESKPDGFEAYFLRGIAKYYLGDYKGAAGDFSKTVSIHPLYTRAYQYRGIAYDRMFQYQKAINDFDYALKQDPFDSQLFLARGDTKMHLQEYLNALKDYNQAIRLNPKLGEAYLNRGVVYHILKNDTLALKNINKSIRLDYFNVDAWIKRGMVHYALDSLQESLKDYNQAIKIKPNYPFIYFQKAITYLKLKDTAKTIRNYRKVVQMDTTNALTYYNLALLESMKRNYSSALKYYGKVIQINPRNIYAYYNRGIVELELNKPWYAVQDYTQALQIFPDFIGALVNRSIARLKLGDTLGAKKDEKKAMMLVAKTRGNKAATRAILKRYGDSSYFNKVIQFEADFLNGEMKKGRIQFKNINIQPLPDFFIVYAIPLSDSLYQSMRESIYYDKNITQFNAKNAGGMNLFFTTKKIYLSNRNYNKIISKTAEKLNNTNRSDWYLLKGILFDMKQYFAKAIIEYDSSITANNKNLFAYFNRGSSSVEREEELFTKKQYTQSITISRSNFQRKRTYGEIPEPQYRKAMADFNKVILLNPQQPFVYYNRANIYLRLRKFDLALRDYTTAVNLEPKMGEAYYNRALILLYQKKNKKACNDLSKAGELGINNAYNVIKRYCTK